MQPTETKQDTAAWPVGRPSRYGPIATQIHNQTRLEFRAHDGQPDAVESLLHPANRAERLRLARAIGHAAHCLREEEGLSNDVVNLIHEANRLIARRPIPPRRRKMDLQRIESFLTDAGIGPGTGAKNIPLELFPADELEDPHLRLRLDFIGHNNDEPYPNVIIRVLYDLFREPANLTPTTEAESITVPRTVDPGTADGHVRSQPLSSTSSATATAPAAAESFPPATPATPATPGSGLPLTRPGLRGHPAATLVSALLLCLSFSLVRPGSVGAPLALRTPDQNPCPRQDARPPRGKLIPVSNSSLRRQSQPDARGGRAMGEEIRFVETYALAADRTKVLEQLVPGTEDHFYYTCLTEQHAGDFKAADATLKRWRDRLGETSRVTEMENRQALLKMGKTPKASWEYLQFQIGLNFDHEREQLDAENDLPTQLDPQLLSRDTLARQTFSRYPHSVDGFEDCALDWVAAENLSPEQRRDLLRRLQRPDLPNLVKLIAADMAAANGTAFGAHPIHLALTHAQLDELLKLRPQLLTDQKFVQACLRRLLPDPETDVLHDPAACRAYLERVWPFVERLAPAFNSLRAHLLYHWLGLDRSQGRFDRERFLAYVQTPRTVRYLSKAQRESEPQRRHAANLSSSFDRQTPFAPIGDDEPLVRSYLAHFFETDKDFDGFVQWIDDSYLKQLFAETKLLGGHAPADRWTAMLDPAGFQQLKDRVELVFAPTNRTLFQAGDKVAIDLAVKNVKTIIAKVFELNLVNFYRENLTEVDTGFNLDGLVANHEQVLELDQAPLRRTLQHFEFPSLDHRGVYLLEFIGGGQSCRALIRKGMLRCIDQVTPAGHVIRVLDETHAPVADAGLWLGSRFFAPGKDGAILVPFTHQPTRQPVVLTAGGSGAGGAGFAALANFQHRAEDYRLRAGFHIEREALSPRRMASVIVRPQLALADMPVSLELLENVKLVIHTTDLDGVSASKTVADFKLAEDREATYAFQVPDRLTQVRFELQAEVQNVSRGKKEPLSDSRQFDLNGIDRQANVEDLHLSLFGKNYALELLGKSGEERPQRPLSLEFKHRDFKETIHLSLQTDESGRIGLGSLDDIQQFTATGPEGLARTWRLTNAAHDGEARVVAQTGELIQLPYLGLAAGPAPDRAELCLLELRDEVFYADRLEAIQINQGLLEIRGLPAGDYRLWQKRANRIFDLVVSPGRRVEQTLVSDRRMVECNPARPLQIQAITAAKTEIRIQLAHATPFTRVHLSATRFLPQYALFADLAGRLGGQLAIRSLNAPVSSYISTRLLGDEYTYVIERKYAAKRPGNMLPRPGLLLAPWAVRKTSTSHQQAAAGEAAASVTDYMPAPAPSRSAAPGGGYGDSGMESGAELSNLDFLAEPGVLLTNLVPDASGVVTVKRADLGAHQHLHVVAVDPENTAFRSLALNECPTPVNDLRLTGGLEPGKPFAEQRTVQALREGQRFVIEDLRTSEFELCDSVGRLYGLYTTLLGQNPTLSEFGFIVEWPTLSAAARAEKYSKYACHELNFFLYHKDRVYFDAVVRPHIAHKKDKTFLDLWLLEADLADYLTPWAFARLNIVERILLSRRVTGEGPHTTRHVADLAALLPLDMEGFNQRFDTALKASALETESPLGAGIGAARAQPARRAAPMMLGAGSLAMGGPSAKSAMADLAEESFGSMAPPAPPASAEMDDEAGDKEQAEKKKSSHRSGGGAYRDAKKRERGEARQLYREADKTEEWAENNYYRQLIENQNADLVPVSAFWKDYAAWDGKGHFLSIHAADAARSFTEALLALSVMDLPFSTPAHATTLEQARLTLGIAADCLVFHKVIQAAELAAEPSPVLVNQNFYRLSDRYDYVDNEEVEKYVTGEFLTHVVYGLHVVVTNPGSGRQRLEVLLEIPKGAIAVLGARPTHSRHVAIEPFSSETFEVHFYFPAPGQYPHYPVNVARDGKVLAAAPAVNLTVVRELSERDTAAWDYVSQHANDATVLAYLEQKNLYRVELERIAFRLRDKAFYTQALAVLLRRHIFEETLYSYGIHHRDIPVAREFLLHQDSFVSQCGAWIDTPVLTRDPVARRDYQHLEYSPLINARAHALGKRRQIQNDRLAQQYHALLTILAYRPALDAVDCLSVTYYLLLQDRLAEAEAFFAKIDAQQLESRLQYDYFTVYLAFFQPGQGAARKVVKRYADYPVDRWRKIFAEAAEQLAELDGSPAVTPADPANRDQTQGALAATEGSFEFKLEGTAVLLQYRNLRQVRVNYYRMDIEMLFSRNPFVDTGGGQFAMIRPNESQTLELPAGERSHRFELPAALVGQNVMIEIEAAGVRRSQACFAHSLVVQVVENYGQVQVAHQKTGAPLPAAYIKVYARMNSGEVRFYKDGYTDPRGRFDYSSVSTDELAEVQRFAILVLSDNNGAVVREAAPPKS